MDTQNTRGDYRGLSITTLIFGVLGGVFFWWVPMGMVMSLVGMMTGFVDWSMARRRSLDVRLATAGILLSGATLALNIIVAAYGWQTITFGGF